MSNTHYDSLSQAVNSLTEKGFKESFVAKEDRLKASYSKREYLPSELKVLQTFRFEGMTNPSDQSTLLAVEAKDGLKGTLILSNSSEHNQNTELIAELDSSSQ